MTVGLAPARARATAWVKVGCFDDGGDSSSIRHFGGAAAADGADLTAGHNLNRFPNIRPRQSPSEHRQYSLRVQPGESLATHSAH